MNLGWSREVPSAIGVALIFSFPVAALFEDGFGLVSAVPAALLALYAAYAAIVSRGENAVAMMWSSLFAAIFVALMYLLAPAWSLSEKLNQFALVVALFGVATAYALNSRLVADHLIMGLILLGGFATALLLVNPQEFQAGRLSFGENNPIWMARVVAWLGLGSFALFLLDRRKYLICGALILLSLFGVVMTASRGPLLSLLCACLAGALLVRFRHKWALIGATAFALVAGLLSLVLMELVDASWVTLGSREDSADIRTNLFYYTLDLIEAYPDGIGVGRFNYKDALFYPHNIWLEVFAEWGWLFGIAFLVVTCLGAFGILKLDERFVAVKMLLVFEIVNAGLSGDVTSPRFLYGLLIVGGARLVWGMVRQQTVAPDGTAYVAGSSDARR